MKIHVEIWLAAASLHDRGFDRFTNQQLQDEVRRLFGDVRAGVATYITAHANASANKTIPAVYNYVVRVDRGVNRLCRVGDPVHQSRVGCSLWPEQSDIDEGYWPLWRKWVSWQRDESVVTAEVVAATEMLLPRRIGTDGDYVNRAAERLAAYVRSLPDFQMERSPASGYDHMGAIIAEAILQAGINYQNVVVPRVNALRTDYPQARTTSGFSELLQSVGSARLLNFSGQKPERVEALTRFFLNEGVETEAELRAWLGSETNLAQLQRLPGIGPKTVDYLQILVGLDTSAVDRHLAHFVTQAGVEAQTYDEHKGIINAAASELGVDRAVLDYSIWLYMSTRARTGGGGAAQSDQETETEVTVEETNPSDAAHYLQSTYREAMLEHLLVGELMRCLWPKPLEVYKPQVDAAGVDLILACDGVLRHVQLKTSKLGAATASVNVQTSLWERSGSCVIWTWFDPETLVLKEFLWLGEPGQPLPPLDDLKYTRHNRGNAQGEKGIRPGLRVVPKGCFKRLGSLEELVGELFRTLHTD